MFNLVESLEGSDAAAVAVPALLDGLGVAYTGSAAAAIATANDKCAAKAQLLRLGLPTAPWFEGGARSTGFAPGRHIVKARFDVCWGFALLYPELASRHMTTASLL